VVVDDGRSYVTELVEKWLPEFQARADALHEKERRTRTLDATAYL